jgi:glycine/D-amino acid oxidase-like deaminating enzyme
VTGCACALALAEAGKRVRVYEAREIAGAYWQQTPEGRLVAGGFRDKALESEFTAEERVTPLVQDHLGALRGRASP